MDKILLIDGANSMWRAAISFGPPVQHRHCTECTKEKHPVAIHCNCGALWDVEQLFCYGERYVWVYNFFRNLRPQIEQFQPDKVFFALEGRPQFRYDLYADYKANRLVKQAAKQETMDKFAYARDIILNLIEHLPITIVRAAHYEADDLISTLCDNMKEEELTVISNDSDYIQLLQRGYANLNIWNPIKKEMMAAPDYHYIAWKAIAGDKSDNIPSLLTKQKALNTIQDPKLFEQFMSVQEQHDNFQVNRQLIEFAQVPEEEIEILDGARDFAFLHQAFEQMKFVSLVNSEVWDKFVKTFDCVRY